jgi:phage I-like protein
MTAMKKQLKHRILDGLAIDLAILEDWNVSQGGEAVAWHQVALEGKWSGHWMGPFSLNGQMFDQIVQGFEGQAIDTVVDYEHNSLFGDTAPAAGWIQSLQRRQGDSGESTLWANIKWNARAAGHIRSQEYRYLSPTIIFNSKDRKSGKPGGAKLHSVALTNTPFLHELPEVRLNSLRGAFTEQPEPEARPMNDEQFKALCKVLGMSEDSTVEQAMTALAAKLAEGLTAGNELHAIRQALELGEGQPIADAVSALKVQATAIGEDEIVAMRAQLATLTAANELSSAEQLVDGYQRQGKVAAKDTENYKAALAFAQRSPDGFKAFMDTVKEGAVAPVVETPAVAAAAGVISAPVDSGKEFALYAKQLNLSDEDIKKAREAGVL